MLCVQQGERGSTGSKGFAGAPGDKVKQENDLLDLPFKVAQNIASYHAYKKLII